MNRNTGWSYLIAPATSRTSNIRPSKTGSINTLITKGYVVTDGEKDFTCDVVYNGVVVGKVTKSGKVYKLVQKD